MITPQSMCDADVAADAAAIEAYFRLMWPDDAADSPGGHLNVWTLEGRRSYWFPINQAHKAAAVAAALAGEANVYCGTALIDLASREQHDAAENKGAVDLSKIRGTSATAREIPGVWADIDVGGPVHGPAHKSTKLPPTYDDALALIREAIPLEPTLVIDSGHGVYGWWLFQEPWWLDTAEDREDAADLVYRLQYTLQERAKAHGWEVDGTADLARVLRMPGTINRKLDPVPVRILTLDETRRYQTDAFDQYLLDPGYRTVVAAPVPLPADLAPVNLDTLPIPPYIKLLIINGNEWREDRNAWQYGSRSQAVWRVVHELVQAGCADATIASILLDERYAISENPLEKGRRARRFVAREIGKARIVQTSNPKIVFGGNGTGRLSSLRGTLATPAPWPEPARILGLPPAPALDLSLFPPEIANVALDASERLQAPPDYLAWGQTTVLAGLIGRRAGVRPRQYDDWAERACLWVVLIGDPSWMKSPSIDEMRRPLRRQEARDRAEYERAASEWEADCDAIRAVTPKGQKPKLPDPPAETRRATSDATIEKLAELIASSPGLTDIRDEVSGLVGSFNRYAKGEGDRQFWLECYSGGAYTVDRVGRGTVRVSDLYLNLLGGTQIDKARELFGEGPDDGFSARVTGIFPEMPPAWEEHDRWPDRDARVALDGACDRLVAADWPALLLTDEWKPLPYARLHPEAGALWSEWHAGLMARLRAGEWEGRHAGRIGKYPGLAARLTLVWHLVDWAAGRVSDDGIRLVPVLTLARVLDLMDHYLMPMDARIYRAFDRSSAANGGARIARWISEKHPASFTLREVRRHAWSGLTESDAIADSVEWLAAMGWVREADPEQRTGRPANRYDVNPRVWEAGDAPND